MAVGPGELSADRPEPGHPPVTVGGVTLDLANRNLLLPASGAAVPLTPLQAALLAHLMRHSGEVCSRDDLMRDALGYRRAVGSRTVDVHVATLRGKLRGALEINAVRGVGYALRTATR